MHDQPFQRQPALSPWLWTALLLAGCGAANETSVLAQAEKSSKAGEHQAASIELKTFLQKQPESGPVRHALGVSLLEQGDAAGAEAEFRRAMDADTAGAGSVALLARALLQQRKFGPLAKLEAEKPPSDPRVAVDLLTTLAQGRQAQGDLVQARSLIDKALSQDPAHPGAQVMDVRLAASTAPLPQAAARAATLAQRFPNDAEVILLLADAQAASGEKEATRTYEQVLRLDKRQEAAHGALIQAAVRARDYSRAAALVQAMKAALPGRGLPIYYDAVVAYASTNLQRAREQTQLLLKAPEPNPLVQMLAGYTEQRLGSLVQAEALLSRALKAMPDHVELRRELAAVYSQLGRPDAALQTLMPKLSPGLKDAPSWLAASRAYSMMGNFKAADAALALARSLQPNDGATRLEAARTLLARGSEESGLRELEALAQSADPAQAQALADLVPVLMRRHEVPAALAAVDKLVTLSPKSPQPELLRGQVLLDSGNISGARAAFEAALTKDPRFVLAVERLAQLDLGAQDHEAARKRYLAFLKANPQSAPVMLALAEITRLEGSVPEQIDSWLDKAVQAEPLEPQTWISAIQINRRTGITAAWLSRAERAATALPADAELQVELSLASRAAGQLNQAQAAIGRAVALQPKSATYRLMQADLLLLDKNTAGARKAVDQARELEPLSFEVERANVMLLVKEDRIDQALAAAEKRRKRLPRDLDSLLLEADVHGLKGQAEPAMALLREALALSNASFVASRVSEEIRRTESNTAALKFERDWLRNNPKDAAFMAQAAQHAAIRGDAVWAEELYRLALALQPGAALSLNNLASLLLTRKPAEALTLAKQAVKLMPSAPALLDTLAQAQAAAGQLGLAVTLQSRAVQLDPESPLLRLTLAKLQLKAGDKDKARQELRRLQDRYEGKELPEEINSLLKQVES